MTLDKSDIEAEAHLLAVARARIRVALIHDAGAPYSGVLHSPEAVYQLLKGEAVSWDRERFLTLMLDAGNRLIGIDEVSVGTLDTAPVHPREVFKALILANAAAFICVHNHPSGDPTPSASDFAITGQLERAGRILGIKLLDHIVIAARGYRALSEENLDRPRVDEPRPTYAPRRVPLGHVSITSNALRTLDNTDILQALGRHGSGDWGDVGEDDCFANEAGLKAGGRILSSYRTAVLGIRFWIITEADRSSTTVLLPLDY